MTGYLVFENDKPIGWCNANNRLNYQRLLKDYDYIDNPDDKVCSIVCLKRTKKQLSEELNIHYTRLSRIINDREEPNVELTYRLEKRSGELVPALIWWKLMMKKQEYNIRQDKKTRNKEASKVKNSVNLIV